MKSNIQNAGFKRTKLAIMVSAMIMGHQALQPSYAQESTDDLVESEEQLEEIIVTGIRGALQNAREIKRNADTFVDSISSSDVSALPDLSVAEALQRIPGVVVNRVELGGNGGDFPSTEGSGNIVRGLPLVRSEFNGRDAFSANGGRALDWSSIPPELVGGVDVFKNQSADLIEGGISGTINLRTLEPFDREGLVAVVATSATYTDLRDEVSPTGSAVLGNRWELESGAELGLMGSYSNSQLLSRTNGFQLGHLTPTALNDGRVVAVPGGVQLRDVEFDRDRESAYLAGQFRSPSGEFEATAKYIRAESESVAFERTFEFFAEGGSAELFSVSDDSVFSPFATEGINLCSGNSVDFAGQCDPVIPITDGLFESGLITNNHRAWLGAQGAEFRPLTRSARDKSITEDLSLNLKWNATDNLFLSFDANLTKSEASNVELWGVGQTFLDYSLSSNIDNPQISVVARPDSSIVNGLRGGVTGPLPSPTSAGDPAGTYFLAAKDQFRQGDGELWAVRVDGEYAFEDSGWFESVKFGARLSERDQVNNDGQENWSDVAAPWGGGLVSYAELPEGTTAPADFSDFLRGGVVSGDANNIRFISQDLIEDYDAFTGLIANNPLIVQPGFQAQRADGVVQFDAQEISDINEEVQSVYARLDFSNEFENGTSLKGNVGLRYVRADIQSAGFRTYNELDDDIDESALALDDPQYHSAAIEMIDDPRDFLPETAAFFDQAGEQLILDQSDDFLLPSLNLKYNLNDEMLIRFGASKAITRPNVQDVRAQQSIGRNISRIFPQRNGEQATEATGPTGILGARLNEVRVGGGNPNLQPTESVNLDLAFEWYFGDSNSFSASLFKKDLTNTIVYGEENRGSITLDGQTVSRTFVGLVNLEETEILGAEFAYTQFYDQLPGWMSNLGLQLNYTYIDSETPTPVAQDPNNPIDGDTRDSLNQFRYGVDDALGLSKHSGNIVGIYQSDKTEFRIAYNYRGEYLNSFRDYITGNPIYQSASSTIDLSAKYNFNDNLQVNFSVANVLDTDFQSEQQIDQAGQRFGRSTFLNDRRFVVGLRYQY